jgi:hypothetical protein
VDCGGDQPDIVRDIEFHGYESSVRMGSRELLQVIAPTDEVGIALIVCDWGQTWPYTPCRRITSGAADGLTMFVTDGSPMTRPRFR